ncbi:MAG TPA: hypothetical protein V6C71_09340 [Coleofasciculaceae cyanobacterium]|jgi:hypothetical protein
MRLVQTALWLFTINASLTVRLREIAAVIESRRSAIALVGKSQTSRELSRLF